MISRPEAVATPIARRTYIDWVRGLAVLIMIGAHVLDAWTLRSERSTLAFAYFNILGGFAAPLFLWLAGLSLAFSAQQKQVRTGDRGGAALALMRRGLQILVLAYLFRLQAFIVSPGNPLMSLLRVDILNIMGPSMVAAAFLWGLGRGPRGAAAACAAAAAGLALVTPLARTASGLEMLPAFLQWYVSPSGNHSTFTLFPWAGFVFAGAACGAVLVMVPRATERRAMGRFAAAGFVIVAGSYYLSTRASIYATAAFWTTSPTYFGVRAGILMMVLAAAFAMTPIAPFAPRAFAALERLGRHSLFVYWIHVELVYGYTTAPIHHRLPLWANMFAYLIFVSAMYWAIALKERVVSRWQPGTASPPPPGALARHTV